MAGFDIEIHPVSLDGLNDSKGKQSKDPGSQEDTGRGKPKPGRRNDEKSSRRKPRGSKAEPKLEQEKPARAPKPDRQPTGTRPTTRPPTKAIKPKSAGKPKRGLSPRFKAGAGAAGGLAMGAMASGMDWRQAAADPKAALNGLKGAAVQAGKDKIAGMMDPANLSDTMSQVKDAGARTKDFAAKAKDKLKGGKVDTKGLKDEAKALKDNGAGLKDNLKAVKDHEGAGKKASGKVGGVAKNIKKLTKAIRTGSIAQKVIGGLSKAWSVIQQVLNGVWNASPVGWVTLAIGAAIIAITLIVTHWDEVKSAFSVVKKNVLEPVGEFFEKVFAEVLRPFTSISDGVSGAFRALCRTIQGVFKKAEHQVAVVIQGIADALDHFSWFPGVDTIVSMLSGWASAHMADGGVVGGQYSTHASDSAYLVTGPTASEQAARSAMTSDHLRAGGRDTGMAALNRSPHIAPTRGVRRTATGARVIDRSTTIALDRRTDGAFARTRSLHAQRALTYAGGLR
ncbi:hypothetical protein AB0N05_35280 [Nocardia sp. NPDC051030]|uniref:hypothetical protein n=1 Tax=Nocardia sp. NPDC051030 TaxID=3155162 RepID=UPI00341691C8